MKAAGYSHVGRVRRDNQDVFYCARAKAKPEVYLVADGMGGAKAGDAAALLARSAALHAITQLTRDFEGLCPTQIVRQSVQEANEKVYAQANADRRLTGMGTTLTLALCQDGHLIIGHVGDSRAYLLRGGNLRQVTVDHSLVQQMVQSGELTQEGAQHHPNRNMLCRALGTSPDVDVDVIDIALMPGDIWLLCSDGLSQYFSLDELAALLQGKSLSSVCKRLVSEALAKGGADNITAVVMQAEDAKV